ncbi:hypothetical protein K438DRAFT_332593 [Mycena galopus ATCC 62051]|nr:hypothetical protein K438DRAFT_332593 [Mycena galopus ATCC 62051]
MRLPHSFIAVLFAVLAKGALTNTTVDDTSFIFGGTWTAVSTKSPCTSTSEAPCPAQPDPSQTSGGTWHVGTIPPGASQSAAWGSLTFKGSAVYIFGIDQAGQAEIDFALDQITNPDIHKHQYAGTQQFAYNAPFFSATGLTSDQMHTVYWGLKATGNTVQFALFDYAIVTSGQEGTPTTGGVENSGPATTQTTTPTNSELPSEPVTPTPSSAGSSAMSSPTWQKDSPQAMKASLEEEQGNRHLLLRLHPPLLRRPQLTIPRPAARTRTRGLVEAYRAHLSRLFLLQSPKLT